MLSLLKDHPFAVEAFFERSVVLTFALPAAQLQPLLPECLQLDVLNGNHAFIAVAMVQTKNLRPKGFPKLLGNDFFLIGYRVFVKYVNTEGRRLRGLYILKSETDKRKMEIMGNLFTHYKYTTTDVAHIQSDGQTEICSVRSDFRVVMEDRSEGQVALPEHSPFADWKEARRYAGPLPFTFTYDAEKKEVLIIEGVRQNWIPRPVRVHEYRFSFFRELNLSNALLANAFIIENIPYFWKKGKKEKWSR